MNTPIITRPVPLQVMPSNISITNADKIKIGNNGGVQVHIPSMGWRELK